MYHFLRFTNFNGKKLCRTVSGLDLISSGNYIHINYLKSKQKEERNKILFKIAKAWGPTMASSIKIHHLK